VYYRLNPDLPEWAQVTLQQTAAANQAFIKPNLNNLCRMGDRPERARSCC